MSFAALPHYLDLLRNAVDKLRHQDEADRAQTLDQMRQVLGRMMVEARFQPELAVRSAAAFGALRGTSEGTDRAAEATAVTALIERQPEWAMVGRALAIDQEYLQAYEQAVLEEVARPPHVRAAASFSAEEMRALRDFIREHVAGETKVEVTGARLASMGYSKKTILVGLNENRILPGEVVVRMDQAFNFLGTTVLDEYRVVKLLHAHEAPVPRPYALEPTGSVLGHPFILFARVAGNLVGTSYFPPPRNDRLTESIARALATIHATPLAALEAIDLPGATGAPFIQSEIERVHRDWKALDGYCAPTLDAAFAWIRANVDKAHGRRTIVHNDFNYHNFLVVGDALEAVLDWEFAHIGNPAADLGYFHEVAERNGGFDLFLDAYAAAGGEIPSRDELDFYILWAHVRFGVMGYQSEAGLNSGRFDDIRYAVPGVGYLRKPLICIGERLGKLLGEGAIEPPRREVG